MGLRADHDILLAKASTVRKCVAAIEAVQAHQPPLESWVVQDVVVLNLQRAAQACLDVAHHLIAANGWELPASARQAFEILSRHGALESARLPAMEGIAGFRNIAVHEYTALLPEVISAIATKHLGDLEAFTDTALRIVKADRPG